MYFCREHENVQVNFEGHGCEQCDTAKEKARLKKQEEKDRKRRIRNGERASN